MKQYINLHKDIDKELKLRELYNLINGKEEQIEYWYFKNAFEELTLKLSNIIPDDSNIITYIDENVWSLCNYYSFEDVKLFFHIFFDEYNKDKVCCITLKVGDRMGSYEGNIDTCIDIIKEKLNYKK
jgi:hypothetical protein